MPKFNKFADTVNTKFEAMSSSKQLFRVNISAEELIALYQDSFPEGENDIYLERRTHDCTICNKFIRDIGNTVTINDDLTLDTIWNTDGLEYPYDVVAKSLHDNLISMPVVDIFLHNEPRVGKQSSVQLLESGSTKTWNHFYAEIPADRYERDMPTKLSKARSRAGANLRSLKEISTTAVSDVIDLIQSNSIYRGEEHLSRLLAFKEMQTSYNSNQSDTFTWTTFRDEGSAIRNSVIGSLLVDLTDGVDIESAVKSFENRVAPSNYQRPKAVVTKGMIEKAIKTIDKLGVRDSLPRRHAVSSDVSINDVLFADRGTKLSDVDPLLVATGVSQNQEISKKSLKNATEITMDKFLSDILPASSKISIGVSGSINANKVSISAPVNIDAPSILKWDNNFSWSYVGNVADSDITTNVQAAGGKTDGAMRFSLQWNENGKDVTDLDIHCVEKSGVHIYHGAKKSTHTGGELDIDITNPKGVAVENIVWPRLVDGTYEMYIHDYSGSRLKDKFNCELLIGDTKFTYEYSGSMPSRTVNIATVTIKNGVASVNHELVPTSETDGKVELVPVSLIMLSPNHWGNNNSGNKHFMFMTDGNTSTEHFRGFYNEYLKSSLSEDRKAFDLLSSKMMVEPTPDGLTGFGFSSTSKQDIYIKADNKMYCIKL